MKKIAVVAVFIALSLLGCATVQTVKMDSHKMLSSGAPTVVIIGGAGATLEQLEPLHQALKGSVAIVPNKYYPLGPATDVILQQIRAAGAHGPLVLIGHSWGGYLAREVDAMNPGFVVAIITIATPVDIQFVPTGFGDPFHPDDTTSKTPLYVIAGLKPGAEKKWYMWTSDSDGVADVQSVLNAGRELKASAVIEAGHSELIESPEVIDQVKTWLEPEIKVATVVVSK